MLTCDQLLVSSYLQGADADHLNRLYESEAKVLEPWVDSPGEVSTDDWRDHLGYREYVLSIPVYTRMAR